MINLTWFKRKELRTNKRVLLKTEGREEDLQLLILQNIDGWTLEGDASKHLAALLRQEQEDKLSDAISDGVELCRERWGWGGVNVRPAGTWFSTAKASRTKPQDYGHCTLRPRAARQGRDHRQRHRSVFSPLNNHAVRAVRGVCGVRRYGRRARRKPTTAATRNSSIALMKLQNKQVHLPLVDKDKFDKAIAYAISMGYFLDPGTPTSTTD